MRNKEDMLNYLQSDMGDFGISAYEHYYDDCSFSQMKLKYFFIKFAQKFDEDEISNIFKFIEDKIKND